MTVNNNDNKILSQQEISDDTYWQTYFESETIPLDVYFRRLRVVSKHGDQQEQSTTQRLDSTKEKQKSKKFEFIYDR